MKQLLLSVILIISSFTVNAQLKAYQIFDKEGKEVTFEEMSAQLESYNVVFFGELHNNPIAHWLQFELSKSLAKAKDNQVIFGAEMFEKDNQLVLDEYLKGLVKEAVLIKDGKAWDNYKTDYAPLVDYAKEINAPFFATNVPRRYASLVAKQGLDTLKTLDKKAQKLMAPLPIEVPFDLPSYKEMEQMMAGHGMKGKAKNFVCAQAIKDATMGYSIAKAVKKNKNKMMIHFNGNFHSKDHEGTVWYVNQYYKKANCAVISFVQQADLSKLDDANKGKNEFTIVCNENMTKTF
ncbi:ChaN family lipoprotein [Flammeovirga yaeyamensis]|uniref:ChaN family lipoprotein n=1 Tax=Flammeovirga yaeyamensis TaxID=367791 RepID=A0AAX1N1D8_9BACT|nr:ChaN family lipoprotein [Flammeovirga yaeyamensis]MBB3698232.1 putative iron-regulated protein [Flammeovirga yaeyamensis]NMF34413.1 ChaN family lipoprotein [Flammeovirga yaeyamensis]QWG01393.1 ChaN family lipoprotein [Flammeovirga yaeyamensis]